MATFKYFSDINGETVELQSYVQAVKRAEAEAMWPGVKFIRYDGYSVQAMYDANRKLLPITRAIEMKARPSRHNCDARCFNATGRVMKCECSCGGKNHGRGAFHCSAVAA